MKIIHVTRRAVVYYAGLSRNLVHDFNAVTVHVHELEEEICFLDNEIIRTLRNYNFHPSLRKSPCF